MNLASSVVTAHAAKMSKISLDRDSVIHVCLWLIIALLAFGAVSNLQPTRLLVLLTFVILLINGKVVRPVTISHKLMFLTSVLWVTWGVASLIWSSDALYGVDELITIIIGFITIFVFMNLNTGEVRLLHFVRKGWVAAYVLTLPLAIWEFTTNQHLQSSLTENLGTGDLGAFVYAGVTFGNRNNYAAFIVLCLPFILWSIEQTNKVREKLFFLVILIFAIMTVFINGSRSGMVCLVLQFLGWAFFRKAKKKTSVGTLLRFLLFLAIPIYFAFQSQQASLNRFMQLQEGLYGDSQVTRTNMYINGLRLFGKSLGFGVGAGGLESRMLFDPDMLPTENISAVHNLWIEILAKYGALVFGVFILWLCSLFWSTVRARRCIEIYNDTSCERATRAVMLLLISYPLCFLMNSSILRWAMLWTTLATLSLTNEVIVSRRRDNWLAE